MSAIEPDLEPDTKDWTWVLQRPCPECGLASADVATADLAPALRADAADWQAALDDPDVARRRDPATWSVLEYACHVRDVHRVMARRVGAMLTEDEPTFANWDQDASAVEERYAEQEPGRVAAELAQAAETAAEIYAGVTGPAWERRGHRSNGSTFTVASIGRYHLHDVHHHTWDVRRR